MTLIRFSLEFYEDLVDMYYNFTKEVYPDRQIGERYFFYKEVMSWVNNRRDVVLAINNNDIIGFSMGYVDSNSGLTEEVYNSVIQYVKPEYRKSKAAYMLIKNVSSLANELKLNLMANAKVENGTSDMVKKHFDCKEIFTNLERDKNANI